MWPKPRKNWWLCRHFRSLRLPLRQAVTLNIPSLTFVSAFYNRNGVLPEKNSNSTHQLTMPHAAGKKFKSIFFQTSWNFSKNNKNVSKTVKKLKLQAVRQPHHGPAVSRFLVSNGSTNGTGCLRGLLRLIKTHFENISGCPF